MEVFVLVIASVEGSGEDSDKEVIIVQCIKPLNFHTVSVQLMNKGKCV